MPYKGTLPRGVILAPGFIPGMGMHAIPNVQPRIQPREVHRLPDHRLLERRSRVLRGDVHQRLARGQGRQDWARFRSRYRSSATASTPRSTSSTTMRRRTPIRWRSATSSSADQRPASANVTRVSHNAASAGLGAPRISTSARHVICAPSSSARTSSIANVPRISEPTGTGDDEPHAVETVVQAEARGRHADDLGHQRRQQAQREKAVRDRRTQRRVAPRALGIDVDPLVVAAHVRELVDQRLRDGAPRALADALAAHALEIGDAGEDRSLHHRALRTRNPSSRFASTGG